MKARTITFLYLLAQLVATKATQGFELSVCFDLHTDIKYSDVFVMNPKASKYDIPC
jgi:hypothetical protein